ncbi:MAG: CBS domain-containing protein [Candidatus Bathyarchaeota archaeon]|nr:MAG: CBS domain-containing protein [Candidatus Bathyarchaeota archaeon]
MEKFPSIVADIMSSPVVTLDGEVNIRDAALLMTDKRIGSIVIIERGQPVGIVTKRDILERVVCLCLDPCEIKMKDIMSSPLTTVTKETTILDAMRKMRELDISRLVVMDGVMSGIVSEADIIRACSIASLTSFSTLLKKRQ